MNSVYQVEEYVSVNDKEQLLYEYNVNELPQAIDLRPRNCF